MRKHHCFSVSQAPISRKHHYFSGTNLRAGAAPRRAAAPHRTNLAQTSLFLWHQFPSPISLPGQQTSLFLWHQFPPVIRSTSAKGLRKTSQLEQVPSDLQKLTERFGVDIS